MWKVQIQWIGSQWVWLPGDYPSQDAAEWAIAGWNQQHRVTSTTLFRTVRITVDLDEPRKEVMTR